jgi:hypothetical protein
MTIRIRREEKITRNSVRRKKNTGAKKPPMYGCIKKKKYGKNTTGKPCGGVTIERRD